MTGCHLSIASAQDNPCLAQEATISAQQVIILEMQATNLANSNLYTGEPLLKQITVEVIITATDNPDVTPVVRVVTATPDRIENVLPTLNVTALGAPDSSAAGTATSLPQNCIPHVLAEGDTPFGVAVEYDANPFLLLEANGLTEEDAQFLEIGDVLIIPLEGCDIQQLPTFDDSVSTADDELETLQAPSNDDVTADIEDTEEPEATPTSEFSPTPAPSPTITLAPTAANASIEILGIVNAGDVTAEGVRIRNNGATVNMTGWTLIDAEENEFAFNEQLIFSNTEITIYTRAGQDTPIALFWGLDTPLWAEGDIVSLVNERGDVQATIRLDASAIDLE
ncbi:MAG: LysM peptidoglycan-binding domain-containing protein [Aggregatilineales bacterium]